MPKMTKVQTAKLDKLRKVLSEKRDVIYAFGPNRETVFSECYKLATPEAKKAYDESWRAVMEFESEMVAQGRAWRASYGMFTPNYR